MMDRLQAKCQRATRSQGILITPPPHRTVPTVRPHSPVSRQPTPTRRVIILADTPNIFRSIQRTYRAGARPDYRQLFRQGERFGRVRQAIAFVNEGVHPGFTEALERLGYTISRSEAHDVDDHLTARAVALHDRAERDLLGSGDGDYLPLVALLQAQGKEVVVSAVAENCSRRLRRQADHFFDMPTLDSPSSSAIPGVWFTKRQNFQEEPRHDFRRA